MDRDRLPLNLKENNERRFDRGAWLALAVVLGWFLAAVLLMGISIYYPTDGWVYKWDDTSAFTATDNISGLDSPLRSGDAVVGINGQQFSAERLPSFPPNLQPGQVLVYTIQRDGQAMDVEMTLVRPGLASYFNSLRFKISDSLNAFIPSLLSFLLAGLIFYLRPGNLGARYLVMFFGYYFSTNFGWAVSSLYIHSLPPYVQMPVGLLTAYSWFWFFFPTLTLLSLAFPVVKLPLRRFPLGIHLLVYGIPVASFVIGFSLTVLTRQTRWENYFVPPVGIIVLALGVVSLFGSLIHNWLTLREAAARAQMRWLVLGLGLGLGLPFTYMLVMVLIYGEVPSGSFDWGLWIFLLVPVCLGIAITRYRLFDIDLIIRRTLVYSLLTGLLALLYFGSVTLLQSIFTALGGSQSPVITVISTLAIAALSNPLRRRIQDFIDRRFYRQKYDADKALAEFAEAARSETDIQTLTAQLVAAVQSAIQPESTSVWMRPAAISPLNSRTMPAAQTNISLQERNP